MRCSRCVADLRPGARFCTRCGEPAPADPAAGAEIEEDDRGADGASFRLAPVQAQLVHCPECEAANAVSRRFCGRCGASLRPGEAVAELLGPPPEPPPAREGGVPATLVVVTVLAALAIVGVVLTILSTQNLGLFAGPGAPATPGEPVAVEVAGTSASSEVPRSGDRAYGPENLVDGDASTAWKEGVAGDGEGEWVELDLAAATDVVRLLVWNGYQREGQFRDHSRVARARIEVGERTFTADLVDVTGPQAIDLPDAVRADRVRVTILGVHSGRRYEDTALSRLEVHARPDTGN